jgi:putative phosphoesterase
MRFLIIGDSHLPDRADFLPAEILEGVNRLRKEGAFDGIFFTGDFTDQALLLGQLKEWAQAGFLKIVQGNMDEVEPEDFPIFETYAIPNTELIIGLTHGTQVRPRGDRTAAEEFALAKGTQILIIGHSHAADVFLGPSGTLILNPGSCVGAWSFVASGIPSFLLLVISGGDITVSLYEKHQVELRQKDFHFLLQRNKILPGK